MYKRGMLVKGNLSNALRTYLTGAGAGLWSYYALGGVWVSNRKLTDAEVANILRTVGGSYVILPIESFTSNLG